MRYDEDYDYEDSTWDDAVAEELTELFCNEWRDLIPKFVNTQTSLPYKVVDSDQDGLFLMYGNLGFIHLAFQDLKDIYYVNDEHGFRDWFTDTYREMAEENAHEGFASADDYEAESRWYWSQR